jgi:predicted DNA-binding transcriptional regulator YafY
MTRNFARYEQFLRIHALFDVLSAARQPLDDQTLIGLLRERLGLSRLSARTLHRDCEFLVACGYPLDRTQIVGDRRQGWVLAREAAGRQFPGELPTILELVAFNVARDLLRTFEGTILWTGIESLRSKIEKDIPAELVARANDARRVFHVETVDTAKYAGKPRLMAAISTAITDCREIEVESRDGENVAHRRIQPTMLLVRLPQVQLLGWEVPPGAADPPVIIDIDRIDRVKTLDNTFTPRPIDPAAFRGGPTGTI